MRESSIALYNDLLLDYNFGTIASVEFDFEKIWEFRRKHEDYFNAEDLLFVHTHPVGMSPGISEQDMNCVRGYQIAFKSAIYFAIVCFKNEDLHDLSLDGCLYYCHKGLIDYDNSFPWCTPDITDAHLALLKVLSCGGE